MRTIEQEQSAFDELLPELIKAHQGEFVLFKDGAPVAFFPSFAKAYEDGLRRFGSEENFLIDEVALRTASTSSLSWETGAMFAR